jgi:DNA-binding protein Fis
MNANEVKPQLRLKDRLESLCLEMIDRGILFPEAMEQFEKCFIKEIMRRNNGNLMRTAEVLGMHRNTLSKKTNNHHSPAKK